MIRYPTSLHLHPRLPALPDITASMLPSGQVAEQDSKPAAAKRSLFKKPSWSKPVATDNSVDLFRRADSRYTDIVHEQEQRRLRKKARVERERQRQVLDDNEGGTKRRRLSGREGNVTPSQGAEDVWSRQTYVSMICPQESTH